jgi:hypothetical protein
VCATVVALAGIAAALLAAGVFTSSPQKATTVIVRNRVTAPAVRQPGKTRSKAPSGGTGPTTSPPPSGGSAPGTTLYSSQAYSADYPSGWLVAEDSVDKGSYRETKFQSPDGSATVVIDRTPGQPLDPQTEAAGVEAATSRTPGYQRIAFQPVTIGARPGFKWVFDLPAGRRIDYFTNFGGGRFAVLGHGSDYAAASSAAGAVADSLQ